MNKHLVTIAAFAFCASAFASTAKEKLAEQLLESSGAKFHHEETYDLGYRHMFTQMAKDAPPKEQAAYARAEKRVSALIKKEMGWTAIKPAMVKLYADTYTEEEMKAAIAFYKTPAGKSMAKKLGKVGVGSMKIGVNHNAELLNQSNKIMMEELSGENTQPRNSGSIGQVILNDGRMISAAANQYLAETAAKAAPLSEIRKFLLGYRLSEGVKIGVFDRKKPGAIELVDIDSKKAEGLALTYEGEFVLAQEGLDASALPDGSELKNNLSKQKGVFVFSVETGKPVTK